MSNVLVNIGKGAAKKIRKIFINPYKKIGLSFLEVRVIKNLPDKQYHTVRLLGHNFSFYSRDEFLHSVEEILIGEIYKQKLKPNCFIIDCGANIGLSVIYLKRLFPQATIIAFEPDDTNFSLLEKNIKAFSLNNVELRKEAVWKENTKLNFINEGSLMSRINERNSMSEVRTIEVKATRLKDIMKTEIDFLKIDIEGAEYEVVKDIEDKLNLVKNLFIEYHGTFKQNDELLEIFKIVSNAGFQFYIREAIDKHPTPFQREMSIDYDVQLNIFCFRP